MLSLTHSLPNSLLYYRRSFVWSSVATITIHFLILKRSGAALRSASLLTVRPMEVDDQELAQSEDESTIERFPRTSSEPEHRSASEESK